MTDELIGAQKMDYTDRELLVRIATQTEAILERLHRGDAVLADYGMQLAAHDRRITSLQERIRDFDGGDGWPSWVTIQKEYLRNNTIRGLAVVAFGSLTAALTALGAWLTAPFWHGPK